MSDPHLTAHRLTAGAERVLRAVLQEAENPRSLSLRLLEQLLQDEGNATELLRAARVVLMSGSSPLASSPPLDTPREWQQQLIRRADHFAVLSNADGPTGSEHLLLAIMDLDPAAAQLLLPFGLTCESILKQITIPEPVFSGPSQLLVQITPAGPGAVEGVALFRILDASANRAREGLRVVEDYVRFRLDDAILSRELKTIRHLLTSTLNHLGQAGWASSRDTLHDVGTLGTLASERQRGTLTDVLRANLKRVEEALRTLEEYSKLLDSQLSLQLSECRYRMYTVEKMLEATLQRRQRLQSCQLYLLVTASECRYGPEQTIRHSLEKGVDVIQIREKGMSDRQLVNYTRQVRDWMAGSDALLIMNDRPDLAAAAGADGVHLGQDDLSVQAARQILGPSSLIGVSTHSSEQVQQAIFEGADYLGAGPVFPSQTKNFSAFPGLELIRQIANQTCIPWFAIGGIQAENLSEVLEAGACRIAVSSAICRAPHPRGVTESLKEQLLRVLPEAEGSPPAPGEQPDSREQFPQDQ